MQETFGGLIFFALGCLAVTGFCKEISLPQLLHSLIGHDSADTPGSNGRRYLGRIAWIMIGVILVWSLLGGPFRWVLAITFVIFGVILFSIKILVVLLLLPSKEFLPNRLRLLGDVVLSSLFFMTSFGYMFQLAEIQYTIGEGLPTIWDGYYFAVVTFSTLGYGDFAPSQNARLPAAILAVLGNVHLGLLAGALVSLLDRRSG